VDGRTWDRRGGWVWAGGALGDRSEIVGIVDVAARWERGRALGMGTGSETVVTAGGTALWDRVLGV
jgi:hypothetical protein